MSSAAWNLTGALIIGVATVITPMFTAPVAAGPEVQRNQHSGLVDVYINNVLSNNDVTVNVAAQVAAQVCGLTAQVGIIAEQIQRTGTYRCTNQTTGDQVLVTRNR
jgi:hypothetical protein